MKKYYPYLLAFLVAAFALGGQGCNMEDEFDTTPRRNFEALWKILDEGYCFFEYKEIDWDEVYERYSAQIEDDMSSSDLFFLLGDMTYELKDGHINLSGDYWTSAYEEWYTDYPRNFDWNLLSNYLKGAQRTGFYDEIRYNTLADGQVGYIYYGSFRESILESELNHIFDTFKDCKGLILDVRDNGGGSLTNSDRLASRFLDKKTLCGYIQHKLGKGRNNFSSPYPIYLEPSGGDLWLKPVVLLTNRRCYSAANNFVSKMKILPQVTVLGGSTGGGSGFPFTSELPNGWSVRFSTSPILDVDMQHTEFGIEPDKEVHLNPDDSERGSDTLIEAAILELLYGGKPL